MREDRGLTFLESIAVSAATGAISGAACGVGQVPKQTRNMFTDMMIDIALRTAQNMKQKDREGYINPPW